MVCSRDCRTELESSCLILDGKLEPKMEGGKIGTALYCFIMVLMKNRPRKMMPNDKKTETKLLNLNSFRFELNSTVEFQHENYFLFNLFKPNNKWILLKKSKRVAIGIVQFRHFRSIASHWTAN